MHPILDSLQWRYATKKFDASRKIGADDLKVIQKSISLSASSYGLQPYKVLLVEDEDMRKQLLPHSMNQSQIVDASHLLVFCHKTSIDSAFVNHYTSASAEIRGHSQEQAHTRANYLLNSIGKKSAEQLQHWTSKQAYIALGNLLAVCAELRIDACPLEGFSKEKYDEILGLHQRELASSVLCAIGYRAVDDKAQHMPKVRLNGLFETI